MLTGAANAPRSVMWSITDLAARDGVAKPTVSIRVKRFIDQHNLSVERDTRGRVARLNVAEYDALRERYESPANGPQRANRGAHVPDAPQFSASQSTFEFNDSYEEALRQKTWYDAEQRRINIEREKGRLIETDAVAQGYDRAAVVVGDVFSRIEEHADDLAAVVARDGARGLAISLRNLGAEIAAEIVTAFREEASNLRSMISDDAKQ